MKRQLLLTFQFDPSMPMECFAIEKGELVSTEHVAIATPSAGRRFWRCCIQCAKSPVSCCAALVVGLLLCAAPCRLAAADLETTSPMPVFIAALSGPPTTAQSLALNFGAVPVGQSSSICLKACYCSNVSNCTCDRSGSWVLHHDVAPPFSAFNYKVQPFAAGHPDCNIGTPVQLPVTVEAGHELTYNMEFAPTRPGTFTDYQTLSNQTVTLTGSTPSGQQCQQSATVLCLDDATGDRRFQVTVSYSTTQGGGLSGPGHAVSLVPVGINHGGLLWFFGADNPEMLVKVLNGCATDSHFWVFYAAMTNVGFTVTVTDTKTNATKTYHNTDLTAAQPVQDTAAFACP